MKKVYLQLEFMSGKVFEYSKEPQKIPPRYYR